MFSSDLKCHFTSSERDRPEKYCPFFLKPLQSHETLFYATEETPKGLQKGFYEIGLPLNVSSTEASSYGIEYQGGKVTCGLIQLGGKCCRCYCQL